MILLLAAVAAARLLLLVFRLFLFPQQHKGYADEQVSTAEYPNTKTGMGEYAWETLGSFVYKGGILSFEVEVIRERGTPPQEVQMPIFLK